MSKNHGARQQKKAAKQKAKRSEKRTDLLRRTSTDPTIRLKRAEKWPVVHAFVGANLWQDGIGYLALARQESEGGLIYGVYLVDVFCLGVKNAFWESCTPKEFKDLMRKMETTQQTMSPISPACLAKIVKGAVDYAKSFGFSPHPDYKHASMLLEGIDPSACTQEFNFGKDGKPFYVRGPNETLAQARVISERIQKEGGHYIIPLSDPNIGMLDVVEDEDAAYDHFDEDDSPDQLD